MTRERLLELLIKHKKGQCTAAEERELDAWYAALDKPLHELFEPGSEEANALSELKLEELKQVVVPEDKTPTLPLRKQTDFRRIAVAASLLLLLGLGGYLVFFNNNKPSPKMAAVPQIKDVQAPAITRATLQLADGSLVYIDSVQQGTVAREGNINVVKSADGQIIYHGKDDEVRYNTLVNPKGSLPVSLRLIDGSMVWLNAASTLRYPTSFNGNTREVTISGEAYFEVAHDAARPFFVSKGDMNVQVLGTHFNVKAYDDEESIKVTLLEGSVTVSSESSTVKLKPGEQAVASFRSPFTVHHSPDMEQVMAWKNGLFKFNGEDLHTVMKQVERWYNVEVLYEGAPKEVNFGGIIGRKESAVAVLDLMSLTKQISYRIEPSATAAARIVVIL